MNQIAYLDPSSLSLWIDAEDFGGDETSEVAREAFFHTLFGNLEETAKAVSQLNKLSDIGHTLNLISSIWHEKRHFVDLILTNYGAYRIRQFFSVYINQAVIMSTAIDKGARVVFPFDCYADPLRSRLLNAVPWNDDVTRLAADIKKRREDLEFDRAIFKRAYGSVDIGGDSQLEALGYLSQMMAIQAYFGEEGLIQGQKSSRKDKNWNMRYRWAELFGHEFGLLNRTILQEIDTIFYDTNSLTFLFCVLVASLMCRRWPWKNQKKGLDGVQHPSFRLLSYIKELKDRNADISKMSTNESWDLVNNISGDLWGRTIIEELEADFEEEEKYLELISQRDEVIPEVKTAMSDLHTMRGYFMGLFRESPDIFLEPMSFAETLLPFVQPLPVFVNKSGFLGPSPGTVPAIRYKEPGSTDDEAQWLWASYPEVWPRKNCICFSNLAAWSEIIQYLGPLAKLMFNGRRHRTILGPELVLVESIIEDQLNLKFDFDPSFEFPEEEDDVQHFYFLRRTSTLVCDLCRNIIHEPEGHVVSPWYFRRNENIARLAIEAYGGGEKGRLKFLRDWSPWIFCNPCFIQLIHRFGRQV